MNVLGSLNSILVQIYTAFTPGFARQARLFETIQKHHPTATFEECWQMLTAIEEYQRDESYWDLDFQIWLKKYKEKNSLESIEKYRRLVKDL